MGTFADTVAKAVADFKTRCDAMPAAVVDEASNRILARSVVGDPSLWKRQPPPKDYRPGQFKSNWRLGVDQIDTTTTSEKNSFFLHGRGRMPDRPFGHVFYISNSLPYAWPLETGHSSQGRGMIGLTVAEFDNIVLVAAARVQSVSGQRALA